MIKLDKPAARVILWLARLVQREQPGDFLVKLDDERTGTFWNLWEQLNEAERVKFRRVLSEDGDVRNDPKLDEVLHVIEEQLEDHPDNPTNLELIDEIVRIVQRAGARNVLGGRTLDALRAGLLLPSERLDVIQRLREHTLSCILCGREFHRHEAATIFRDGNQMGVVCTNCVYPTHQPCGITGCDHTVPMSVKNSAIFAKGSIKCPKHSGKEKLPDGAERRDPEGPGGGIPIGGVAEAEPRVARRLDAAEQHLFRWIQNAQAAQQGDAQAAPAAPWDPPVFPRPRVRRG